MIPVDPSLDPYRAPWRGFLFDPYLVARIFGISDPILFQVLKKALRFGRKHKTAREDAEEIISSMKRWLEMEAAEEAFKNQPELAFVAPDPAPVEA